MMDRAAPPNRLPRRAGSGRFPIRVSTSTGIPSLESESSTTSFASASSSQRHTPPAPTRAHHHRFDSQHFSPTPPTPQLPQTAISATTRPSLTPLATGNERLRSNSEGPTPGIRIKRMGMVSRKMSELGTVDEARSSRFSHYRGLSHGSVMQDKHPNGVGPNPDGSSSPVSPAEHDRRRGHFVRRLSSLPEHKRDSSSPDKTVEGVKGVLYSLALVQPYISSLVGVVREGSSKRSSLERVFYNASTHIEQLDRQLQGRIVAGEPEDEDENEDDDESDLVAARSTEGIRRTCLTCVMAYQHVGAQLLRHARQLVLDGDARYVRTLALLVYGGLLELRNACVNLAAEYGDEAGSASPPGHLDRSITPTPHHPRPGGHPRGDVGVGRSLGVAVPTYVPGPPPSTRSNGSVRTGSLSSGTVMATPRSGESFPIPSTPMDFHSRTNTMQSLDETRDDRQFEKIYLKLSQADEIALRTVPTVKQQFVRCIEVCQKQETEKELRAMWTTLDSKCSFIIQLAELLKIKLSGIKLKEPGVWHDREFWQLCSTFVKTFVETALLVKDAKGLELIPTDIVDLIRPASKAVKELGLLIETSPWKHLAASQPAFHHHRGPPPSSFGVLPVSFPVGAGPGGPSGHAVHHSGSNVSPYVSPLPATPLSAALGPAAQATVPSSASSSGPRNGMFSGNVFERADSLLSMPSRSMTMLVNQSQPYGHNPNVVSPLNARAHPRLPG